MTPDEVCEALVSIGATVSRRTLLHYEEAGLIPKPKRGGEGRRDDILIILNGQLKKPLLHGVLFMGNMQLFSLENKHLELRPQR